jgi:hypothetical protein
MLDNNHRIHIQEHIQEINDMKRLTGLIFFPFSNSLNFLSFQMN